MSFAAKRLLRAGPDQQCLIQHAAEDGVIAGDAYAHKCVIRRQDEAMLDLEERCPFVDGHRSVPDGPDQHEALLMTSNAKAFV